MSGSIWREASYVLFWMSGTLWALLILEYPGIKRRGTPFPGLKNPGISHYGDKYLLPFYESYFKNWLFATLPSLPFLLPSVPPSLLPSFLSLSLSLSVVQHLRSTNSDQHFDIWQFITDNYGFSYLHWLQNKYLLLDFEITLIPTINLQESSIYFSEKSRN